MRTTCVQAGARRWPAAQASCSSAASRTGPRFGSAGMLAGAARAGRPRAAGRGGRRRAGAATGTGSYSIPTTRSTARERRSSSAGRRLALDHLDLQVGRGRRRAARARPAAARAPASARTSSAAARAARRPRRRARRGPPRRRRAPRAACAASRRPAGVSSTLRPDAAQQLRARLALELRRAGPTPTTGCRRATSATAATVPSRDELVEQAQAAQFHRSDSRTVSRRKSALVIERSIGTSLEACSSFPLLLAPLVVVGGHR